jgi:ribonuclease III
MTIDFSKLEEIIEIKFKDIELLKQAFTHRSYLNEDLNWKKGHNERLEFLGDAVLELIVSDYLFIKYPEEPEGFMTNLRAALVNADTLSNVARDLNFNNFILLSKGEAKDLGRGRNYILANAFEALIGAIYLDQNYEAARRFIEKNLIEAQLEKIIEDKTFKDPKSLFQEKSQALLNITPIYKLIEEWGPDHDKHFKMGLFLGNEKIAEGEGHSKQEAELSAAKNGLEVKGW